MKRAEEEFERRRRDDGAVLDGAQRAKIESLATDFPRLWKAATTTDRDRKRMIRLLVVDVTLIKDDGQIPAHRCNDKNELLFEPPTPDEEREFRRLRGARGLPAGETC